MKRIALLTVCLTLAGCSLSSQVGSPVPQTSQPGGPAAVYQAVDPAQLQYEDEDLTAAERVAHVTLRQGDRLLSYVRPLWGDREEDRPKIAHILRLIRLARVAEQPLGSRDGVDYPSETLMTVEYTDGTLVQVGLVYSPMGTGGQQSVPGRLYIHGTGEVIALELDEFYRGVAPVRRVDLLVPVSALKVEPQDAKPGESIVVSGEGWMGVEQVAIVLYDNGTQQQWHLGEAQPERGAFNWQGALPSDLGAGPRWRYGIGLEVDGERISQTSIFVSEP